MKRIVISLAFYEREWENVDDAYEQFMNTQENKNYVPGRMESFLKSNLLEILRSKLAADPKYASRVPQRLKNDDK